jgi:phage terminase large subunit-like protein
MEAQIQTRLPPTLRSDAVRQGLDYYFDPEAAKHAVEFFEGWLRHSKGKHAGKPFALLEWQTVMIGELFGWKRLDDDTRRFRVAYISTAKKQGKSTLLAGIGLYLLVMDGENGAEVYGAAADREQASVVYREAASMVRASPQLSQVLEVIDSRRTIAYRKEASFYRVLSADAFRAEGLNIHGLLFDELHAQKDRRLWDALRYGGAAREQPLLVSITTAGYDRKGICYEQYQYAKAVAANWKHDPTFFSCIYEMEEGADWKDADVWPQANPSWGVTIKPADFALDVKEAEQSPTKLNSFLRYRLNTWTTSDVRWLSPETWQQGSLPLRDFSDRPVYAGLDLATTYDLTALVLICPDPEDGSIDVLPFFWIPEANAVERTNRDKVDYLGWIRDGFIKVTDGNVTDYTVLHRDIAAICEQYRVRQLAVDLKFNGQMIANMLQGDGVEVVGYPQGGRAMSAPAKALENLITNAKIRHAGHPVLSWCAGNVAVHEDRYGNIYPSKAKSTERIDGIVALCQGIGCWIGNEQKPSSEPEIFFI